MDLSCVSLTLNDVTMKLGANVIMLTRLFASVCEFCREVEFCGEVVHSLSANDYFSTHEKVKYSAHLLLINLIIMYRTLCEPVNSLTHLLMAALRNRAGHYIFALLFLLPCVSCSFLPSFFLSSSFVFSSLNLSRRRLDVYHTSTHGVALVLI